MRQRLDIHDKTEAGTAATLLWLLRSRSDPFTDRRLPTSDFECSGCVPRHHGLRILWTFVEIGKQKEPSLSRGLAASSKNHP